MKVDDKVTPYAVIVEAPSDDHPGCVLATRGDILIVRRFSGIDDKYIHVSHEHRTDGMTFWVTKDEVEPCGK